MYVDLGGAGLDTPAGRLEGVREIELYRDGTLRSARLSAPNLVGTPSGRLVPAWTWDDARRKLAPSLSFHPGGALKSMRLEVRTEIDLRGRPGLAAPERVRCERLAWRPSGALRRLFPLDGRLGPWWTLKDERALAEPLEIATARLGSLGRVLAASLGFHESGALRSLALWPGETVTVPVGPASGAASGGMEARLGLELREGGEAASLEPARPTPVLTPLGGIEAFDPAAVALTGEGNSLALGPDGTVRGLAAMAELIWEEESGEAIVFAPASRPHPLMDGAVERRPLRLSFGPGRVVVVGTGLPGEAPRELDLSRGTARVRPLAAGRVRGTTLNLRMRVLGRDDD